MTPVRAALKSTITLRRPLNEQLPPTLSSRREPLQRIVPWVYHHQERWDGTGYPDGLKGDAIPLAARIIAVVDAFNAMTTDRPYRKARSVTEARAEIERNAGTQFDPQLAEAFLRLMDRK